MFAYNLLVVLIPGPSYTEPLVGVGWSATWDDPNLRLVEVHVPAQQYIASMPVDRLIIAHDEAIAVLGP